MHTCPAAGMMAPELVARKLEEVSVELWRGLEAGLLALRPLPKAQQLSKLDWSTLLGDLHSGQAAMTAIFTLKTNYWSHLPWLLSGLAHGDAEVARAIAERALAQFGKDSRQETQHRITWMLLYPASHFRGELEKCAAGEDMDTLSPAFLTRVASFRFTFVVETCIEVKHARVTAARNIITSARCASALQAACLCLSGGC